MSTTLKIGYLQTLRRLGKRSLISKSVFGYPYRISLGDYFSENPFYNKAANTGEVLATAAWVLDKKTPVVFDVGGHCGFIASQLANILKENKPTIFSFEPVAPTFSDLVTTVVDLGLHEFIHPISVALSDSPGLVNLSYSKRDSMLSQIIPRDAQSNNRAGMEVFIAPSITLDDFCRWERFPDVIKIDVEGFEVPVFRGASTLLNSAAKADIAICLEWNPEALGQAGFSSQALYELLEKFKFFYLNDYEGQRFPELEAVPDPRELKFCCNLFAMKDDDQRLEVWRNNFKKLKALYNVRVI
ncbi:hypothetical protein BH09BAC3_BH09BAC3_13100 [soil metagenome]